MSSDEFVLFLEKWFVDFFAGSRESWLMCMVIRLIIKGIYIKLLFRSCRRNGVQDFLGMPAEGSELLVNSRGSCHDWLWSIPLR